MLPPSITAAQLCQTAYQLLQTGDLAAAEAAYRAALTHHPEDAAIWHNVGMVAMAQQRLPEAREALEQAVQLAATVPLYHQSLGTVLDKLGEFELAIAAYQTAINLAPNVPDTHLKLGHALGQLGRWPEAIAAYQTALDLKPRTPEIIQAIGLAYQQQNNHAQAQYYFGYAYYRARAYADAIAAFQQAIASGVADAPLYIALGDCHSQLHQSEQAATAYAAAVSLSANDPALRLKWAVALEDCGQTEQAIAVATDAAALVSPTTVLRFEAHRMFPLVYRNSAEVQAYRDRFIRGVQTILPSVNLDDPAERQHALNCTTYRTNFYLNYQGQNDRDLQIQYGEFVRRVMAACYPQWCQPLPPQPRQPGEKIRVGYVSAHLNQRSHWLLGWLQHHDRQQFQLYCYQTSGDVDSFTDEFRRLSDQFHHSVNDLERVCGQIYRDRLHILVFVDIGMESQNTQLANLRLAPVQCVTWFHPVTSGCTQVDYFLSSQLMESEQGQTHYSEQLIRLPNLSFCYPKPDLPALRKTRHDFGLVPAADERVLYLSCQSVFKHLPDFDWVFPAIAQRHPQAQFVFIGYYSPQVTEQFCQRLTDAFAAYHLVAADYCQIVPKQSRDDYLQLLQLTDVFLDSFAWSGGITTLDAVACGLPIVTCPGELMRSRHTYGILQMLSMAETIATTPAEYVDIAVRLGQEPQWRTHLRQQTLANHHKVYGDTICVEALDAFYRQVT